MRPSVQFDVPEMFRRAGPGGKPSELRELLMREHGAAPNLPAVQMWKARGVIPSAWLAAVLYALMKQGHRAFALMRKDTTQ